MSQNRHSPVEAILRDELAHGDAVLASVAPILAHLVATPTNQLFNDQIIARIRGMCAGIAHEMLHAQAQFEGLTDPTGLIGSMSESLESELMASSPLLTHFHALSFEAQLTSRLQMRNGVDPVISPLLQSLIVSDEGALSSGAMMVLTAQARFMEQISRMNLPLSELPGHLFQTAITIWRTHSGPGTEELTARAEMQLRENYDEGTTRLGLLARMADNLDDASKLALSIPNAGVPIFLSALARATGLDRNLISLSTSEQQMGRLALSLCAAGLEPEEIEEQFLFLHPDFALPEGFEMLRSDRAVQILMGGNIVESV